MAPVAAPTATAVVARAGRERPAKATGTAKSVAPQAPAAGKPAANRGLQLDRQDPWQP